MTVDQILALITALATLAAVFFAWRAAKAAKDSVTVAEKAAVAARDSVTVSEKAATAAAQSVAIAQLARREERAAQRIRHVQMIGEAWPPFKAQPTLPRDPRSRIDLTTFFLRHNVPIPAARM
jgi:hypothetical protein